MQDFWCYPPYIQIGCTVRGEFRYNQDGLITYLSHLGILQVVLKPAMTPAQAEVKLVELKNCFVNVPRSIVALLDNANAVSSQIAIFG